MTLCTHNNDKLERISEVGFKLERDIQRLTEDNLNIIFGLDFVCTEFQLNDLRIDSLAFDNETNSFVIIEFKRDKNFSVIDQGYAYLAMLLKYKADFILEYNEQKDIILRKNDVDWSQSRVMFIAPQFTKYQQKAIEFKDLPIELWEISKYSNETILFNQLKSPDTAESIITVSSGSNVIQKVSSEVKIYTEEELLKSANEELKELYNDLKIRILGLSDNIEIKPLKIYLAFKSDRNFVSIEFMKNSIKLWLNMSIGTLDDPKMMARDVSNIGHHGNGDYEISLTQDDDLDYLMTLIKQSFKVNSS